MKNRLLELSSKLRDDLAALDALEDRAATSSRSIADARDDILVDLRLKVLPELEQGKALPVFVGIQGGTNVGKSTIMNALAGQVLSPSTVQASATKHPLVFAHESWKDVLLAESTFPAMDCRELADPKDLVSDEASTEVFYFKFHTDDELESWAFVDSPDFDSALESNAVVARYVSALSDITVFVSSVQKYKDRELVERLRLLCSRKSLVLLVLNMLDEDIVFRTVLDDLRATLGDETPLPKAVRLPRVPGAYPEDKIRDILSPEIKVALGEQTPELVKQKLVHETIGAVVEETMGLSKLIGQELQFKSDLETLITDRIDAEVSNYRAAFKLSLPEETLAIRKALSVTELWPYLRLPAGVASSTTSLNVVGRILRRFSDTTRFALLKLLRRDEGAIDDSPEAVKEYAETRNKTDLENLTRSALEIRHEVESFCRDRQPKSALARSLVSEYFESSDHRDFPATVETSFQTELAARTIAGEDTFDHVRKWIDGHPLLARLMSLIGIGGKIGSGILLSSLLPPDGWFNLFTIGQFAAGYLIGAYVLALIVSLLIRSKDRFQAARCENAKTVLSKTLEAPVQKYADETLRRGDLDAIVGTVDAIRQEIQTDSSAG